VEEQERGPAFVLGLERRIRRSDSQKLRPRSKFLELPSPVSQSQLELKATSPQPVLAASVTPIQPPTRQTNIMVERPGALRFRRGNRLQHRVFPSPIRCQRPDRSRRLSGMNRRGLISLRMHMQSTNTGTKLST